MSAGEKSKKVIQIVEECFVGSGVRTLGTDGLCFIRHSLCCVDGLSLRGRSNAAEIGRLTLEVAGGGSHGDSRMRGYPRNGGLECKT